MAIVLHRRRFLGLAATLLAASRTGAAQSGGGLLYVTHSAGFRHDSIPLSRMILQQVVQRSGAFEVTATEEFSEFSPERLRRYAAVMFFTTGELPMGEAQKAALLDFVRGGGGFLGVHSATDTFYEWRAYGELIGGYFDQHPWHQPVRIDVVEGQNPLVSFLAPAFTLEDEIYQIRDFDERGSRVLLRLAEAPWTSAAMGCVVGPMAGRSPGRAPMALAAYSTPPSDTRRRSGATRAISNCC